MKLDHKKECWGDFITVYSNHRGKYFIKLLSQAIEKAKACATTSWAKIRIS
jgi:hypothetical protein